MRDHRESLQANKVRTAIGLGVELVTEPFRGRADQETADLAGRCRGDLLAERVKQLLDRSLKQLERHVPREAVSDDHVGRAAQQVADLRRGNITIELFQVQDAAPLPESRKNPSEDFRTHGVKHFGFEVKNLAETVKRLEANGIKMDRQPGLGEPSDPAIPDGQGSPLRPI